ncbi:UNVERIFIED_CONTAM: hypothetical protein GTU68_061810 [Idotea baltica]|nr:hypothetical protein [Idotea baltica]
MSFTSLGLSEPILKAIEAQGYDKPSPIQEKAVPAVLTGKDVMAAAQTGTGKTAGFTLPILEMLSKGPRVRQNQVRALVLTPTRELAAQVNGSVVKYGINLPLTSTVVFGGVKINPQMQKLRKGSDVLVATPGRLLDLYNQNAVRFDQLEILVLDEADRMLDMGFIRDIRKILAFLPKKRQNLLFSATFSDDIHIAARGIDIPQLPQVVNFDLPNVSEDYVHRIGRTGRAGEVGKAISLVCADEVGELFGIERLIQQVLERRELEGFAPVNKLPESRLDSRPIKPKKPKKTREHSDGQRSGENARGHKPAGKNKRHVSGSGSAPKRKPNANKPNSGNKGSDSNSAVAGDDKSVRNNGSNYKRGNAAGGAEKNTNSGGQNGAGKPKKSGYGGSYGPGRSSNQSASNKPSGNKPSTNKPSGSKPSRNRSKPAAQK